MDTATQSSFGQKESRLIQCTSKSVKFSLKLGKRGERSQDWVRKVNFAKNQKFQRSKRSKVRYKGARSSQINLILKKRLKITKSQKYHKKSQKLPLKKSNWAVPCIEEIRNKAIKTSFSKKTWYFTKMSYNTNMNNGTSAEDLERVGKLEGTKFL